MTFPCPPIMKVMTVSLPCRAHSGLHAGIVRWAQSKLCEFPISPLDPSHGPRGIAGRLRRRGAVLRETPPSPPQGGGAITEVNASPSNKGLRSTPSIRTRDAGDRMQDSGSGRKSISRSMSTPCVRANPDHFGADRWGMAAHQAGGPGKPDQISLRLVNFHFSGSSMLTIL